MEMYNFCRKFYSIDHFDCLDTGYCIPPGIYLLKVNP